MDEPEVAPAPLPPYQRKNLDLVTEASGGCRPKKAPKFNHTEASSREPVQMMRDMGFDPNKYMTPLQFLLAVTNDDVDMIYRDQKKAEKTKERGGIGLSYRMECAKTAAKFLHMEMPKLELKADVTNTFTEELQRAVISGNARIEARESIIKTIEDTNPDVPLAPASYPPVFEGKTLNNNGEFVDQHDENYFGDMDTFAPPEGDTEYDPDNE